MMPAVALFSKPNGEPIASTHWPGLIFAGSPSLHRRQVGGVDLDHRHVGTLVGADDLGREFAPVGQAHRHLVGVRHHVRVGEDVAVRADDEAGARAAHRRLVAARRLIRGRDAEATEEVEERIVRRQALGHRRRTAAPSRQPPRSRRQGRISRPAVRNPAARAPVAFRGRRGRPPAAAPVRSVRVRRLGAQTAGTGRQRDGNAQHRDRTMGGARNTHARLRGEGRTARSAVKELGSMCRTPVEPPALGVPTGGRRPYDSASTAHTPAPRSPRSRSASFQHGHTA